MFLKFKVHKIPQITKILPSYSTWSTHSTRGKGGFQSPRTGHKLQKENFQDTKYVHESQMLKEKTSKIQTSYIRESQRTQGLQNTNSFTNHRLIIIKFPQKTIICKVQNSRINPPKTGISEVHSSHSEHRFLIRTSLSLSLEFPGYASGYSASVPPLPDSFAVFLVLFASVNHSALPRQRFSVGDLSSAAKRRWKESRGYGGAHQDNDTCLEQSSAAS